MPRRPKSASRKLLAIAGGILAEALAMRVRGYPMGTDVVVRCRRSGEGDEGPIQTGHGLSTNIIEASLEGYLSALNKLRDAVVREVRA